MSINFNNISTKNTYINPPKVNNGEHETSNTVSNSAILNISEEKSLSNKINNLSSKIIDLTSNKINSKSDSIIYDNKKIKLTDVNSLTNNMNINKSEQNILSKIPYQYSLQSFVDNPKSANSECYIGLMFLYGLCESEVNVKDKTVLHQVLKDIFYKKNNEDYKRILEILSGTGERMAGRARDYFRKALRKSTDKSIDPSIINFYLGYVNQFGGFGALIDCKNALSCYNDVLKDNENSVQTLLQIGDIYRFGQYDILKLVDRKRVRHKKEIFAPNHKLALEHYTKALSLQSDSEHALIGLGCIHLYGNEEVKSVEKAFKYFRQVLDFNTHSLDAHYHLGVIYMISAKGVAKNLDEALKHFQNALNLLSLNGCRFRCIYRYGTYGSQKESKVAEEDLIKVQNSINKIKISLEGTGISFTNLQLVKDTQELIEKIYYEVEKHDKKMYERPSHRSYTPFQFLKTLGIASHTSFNLINNNQQISEDHSIVSDDNKNDEFNNVFDLAAEPEQEEAIQLKAGISSKYLGELPHLPRPDKKNTRTLIHYNQKHELKYLESLQGTRVDFEQIKEISNSEISIESRQETCTFKATFYPGKHRGPIKNGDQVTFVFAGRKERALIPQPDKGRCILVLTDEEYTSLKNSLPSNVDVLALEHMESATHGKYENRALITARRTGAIGFLLHECPGVNEALFIDDNIHEVKYNYVSSNQEESQKNSWDCFYECARGQLKDNPIISVKTESPKQIEIGQLGSKIFMFNMKKLREILSGANDMFLLFPPAEQAHLWGEDYYMQIMLSQLFSSLPVIMEENIAILVRSKSNKNAFKKKTASIAKNFEYKEFPGLEEEKVQAIKNTYEILNNIIDQNIERYRKQKEFIQNVDVLKKHAQVNQAQVNNSFSHSLVIGGQEYLIPSIDEDDDASCSERFKNHIHNLTFNNYLRPYQIEAIKSTAELEGTFGRIVLPTGTGKSIVISELAKQAYRVMLNTDKRLIFIVTPQIQLVNQFYKSFMEYNKKETTEDDNFVVPEKNIIKLSSDISSINRSLFIFNKQINEEKLICITCEDTFRKIIDNTEGHDQTDYRKDIFSIFWDEYHDRENVFTTVMDNFKETDTIAIGFSATPPEEDGLENIYTYPLIKAINQEYITPLICDDLFQDYSKKNEETLVQKLPRIISNQYHPGYLEATTLSSVKGIVYLSSTKLCEDAAKVLQEHGIESYVINSKNPKHKDDLKRSLDSNRPIVLLAVDMLRFGYDDYRVGYVIIGLDGKNNKHRDNMNITQIVGRTLRPVKNEQTDKNDKIGYVLAFQNVKNEIISPLFKGQEMKVPISTDYLAQERNEYGPIKIEASGFDVVNHTSDEESGLSTSDVDEN